MNYIETLEEEKLYDDIIFPVIHYLVSLFYKTGCKYYCSRNKINRLLTIYMFCVIKYNTNCFKQDFFIGDESYAFGFPVVYNILDRDIYLPFCVKEDNKEIREVLDESVQIPDIYNHFYDFLYKTDFEKREISNESKELLEIIFRKFGNYSISNLANMLNEIKNNIPIIVSYDGYEIDFENYKYFLSSNINNKIFKFIKNFKNNKIITNNKVKKLTIH